MQQNYEKWHAARAENKRPEDSETLIQEIQNASQKNPKHPFIGAITWITELSPKATGTEAQFINPVLLHSLYLLEQNVPLDSKGPNDADLATNVGSLYLKLSSKVRDNLIRVPMRLRDIVKDNPNWQQQQQLGELAEKRAELRDAETNEKLAVGGAVGSGLGLTGGSIVAGGIIFGLGLVTGPAAPIVWGVLGAIAAIGLVGAAVATYIASQFDEKIDNLENEIGALESPEDEGYPPVQTQPENSKAITSEAQAELDKLNALKKMQGAQKDDVPSPKPDIQKPGIKSNP